jgi:hypothetical protein
MLTDIDYDASTVLNPTRAESGGEMHGEEESNLYE